MITILIMLPLYFYGDMFNDVMRSSLYRKVKCKKDRLWTQSHSFRR